LVNTVKIGTDQISQTYRFVVAAATFHVSGKRVLATEAPLTTSADNSLHNVTGFDMLHKPCLGFEVEILRLAAGTGTSELYMMIIIGCGREGLLGL